MTWKTKRRLIKRLAGRHPIAMNLRIKDGAIIWDGLTSGFIKNCTIEHTLPVSKRGRWGRWIKRRLPCI